MVRIFVRFSQPPKTDNINESLQWLGGSLGLYGLRDRDKSCFRVFLELLKRARNNDIVSSDDLAEQLGLTRGTIVHHLNKLMELDLVMVTHNRYILKAASLSELVEKMRADIARDLLEMEAIAREIDRKLELR